VSLFFVNFSNTADWGNVECLYVNPQKSHLFYPLNIVKEYQDINEVPSNSLNYIEVGNFFNL